MSSTVRWLIAGCLWLSIAAAAEGQGGASPVLNARLFPAGPPPAGKIDVVDLVYEPADTKLAAITLQGQVHRGPRSRIYVLSAPWDAIWLNEIQGLGYLPNTRAVSVDGLFARYSASYERVVVYDPALLATINIATMLAARNKGIVVAPGDIARFGAGKLVEDLRGRWVRNVDAYQWAFDNLWPDMDQSVLACVHPTGTSHLSRDYLVGNDLFPFWVTNELFEDGVKSSFDLEKAFAEQLFQATDSNVPVMGFWYSGLDPGLDEYRGVGLAGEYGKLTVATSFGSNFSLLSGIEVDFDSVISDYRQRTRSEPPALDPEKIYLAFNVVESGDAPSYWQFRQHDVWSDPVRGQVPIGWGMGVSALELVPPIMEWFFTRATDMDHFYPAISGGAYIHPYRDFATRRPDTEFSWRRYLRLSERAMQTLQAQEMGLYTDAWLPFDRSRQDPVTLRFTEGIRGLDTLLLGMGRDEGMNAQNGHYDLGSQGTHVAHVLTRWDHAWASNTREQNIQWLVDEISAQVPAQRPAFLPCMALSWAYGPSELVEVLSRLGSEYVAVSVPHFESLYREAGN